MSPKAKPPFLAQSWMTNSCPRHPAAALLLSSCSSHLVCATTVRLETAAMAPQMQIMCMLLELVLVRSTSCKFQKAKSSSYLS